MNKMKRSIAVLTMAALIGTGMSVISSTATAEQAQAATVNVAVAKKVVKAQAKGKVTVKAITTKSVSKGKKVTVRANVSKSGKSKVLSQKLTVKQGKKTLAKNKNSVSLKAGTYKATSKVKYQIQYKKGKKTYWGKATTKTVNQNLKVNTKAAPVKAQAKGNVTVKAITNKSVNKGKNAFVKPNVSKTGSSKVISQKITVRKNNKVIANNKNSANLSAGTYKIATKVKYQIQYKKGKKSYWGKATTKTVNQNLTVNAKKAPVVKPKPVVNNNNNNATTNTAQGQANLISIINKERAKNGLTPLVRDSGLDKVAVMYNNMNTIWGDYGNWTNIQSVGTGGNSSWTGNVYPTAQNFFDYNKSSYLWKEKGNRIGFAFDRTYGYNSLTITIGTSK